MRICRDRVCGTVLTEFDATGTSGAPTTDLPTGVLFWHLQSRTGGTTATATSPTWQFTVGARTAGANTSWGTTLDVNGDGFADVVVAASGVSTNTGRVYVYLGGSTGLASTPATTLLGRDGAHGDFGASVASAGDVNGDGFADVIVGAIGANSGAGRTYVYLGSASGLTATPATTLSGPDGAGGAFGGAVASAGDVNGDGFADLIVGASGAGQAYVFLGAPSGIGSTPTTSLAGPDGTIGQFGSAVAGAGDVNGDGFGDVVVAAQSARVGALGGVGRAYVYLGSATGLSSTPNVTLGGPDGALGYFGGAVACAGDVNGDGLADVIVGASGANTNTGRAYLYLGTGTGVGSTPAMTLSGLDGMNGYFGGSVASAGDLNGDGFADLVVGASHANGNAGRAYVYLGGGGALASTPASSLSGSDGASGYYGTSVGALGDVNGDTFGDLGVGVPGGASGAGRAYIYLGGSGSLMSTPAASLAAPDGANGAFGAPIARAATNDDSRV